MEKKVTFKASNFSKVTPKIWKRIGNTAIYSLPLLQTAIMGSPMGGDAKQWVGFGVTVLLVAAKGLTKFFTEETK